MDPLKKARIAAGAVLAFTTAVFFSTFFMGDAAWVGYLRAAAEAGMVGGLADWFAVTALFRHPLGIPIPHTAIIPKSKDALGKNLAEFIAGNFLDPTTVKERLAQAAVPQRVGAWLATDEGSVQAAGHVTTVLGAVAQGTASDQVWADLEGVLIDRVQRMPISDMMGRALERAVADGELDPIITGAVRGIDRALADNAEYLRDRIKNESPWWVPDSVDEAVFAKATEIAHRFFAEVAQDPHHQVRGMVATRLTDLADRLQNDPVLQAQVSDRIGTLTERPEFRSWLRTGWSQAMTSLGEQSDGIAGTLRHLGTRLLEDDDLQRRIDGWLEGMSGPVAEAAQRELEVLIPATVMRWDPEETAGRLEQWMGRDLQFVRINGVVVGAMIGLVLHTFDVWFG
jgi:uncharacterized membrane-anchored protein YjiN (DUF445 family)